MDIHIYNRQKTLPLRKPFLSKVVREVLKFLQVECSEISLYFVTDKEITALHAQFFQDPTPTDCISFPLDKDHLGEIFVCPSVALEYAKKRSLDPIKETILYVIHGILHLLGYDDLSAKDRKTMRQMEKKCIAHLKHIEVL